MFYLIRHGQTDYSEKNTKIYQGFGVNLAPLSVPGIDEVKAIAKDIRLQNADIILSSPYTRALQTAAILSRELDADIIVETDLHEWLANKDYIYENDARAFQNYKEYVTYSGIYPVSSEKDWEDSASLSERAATVLRKYTRYSKVIVACHGMLIQSLTGGNLPKHGEIIEYDLDIVREYKQ